MKEDIEYFKDIIENNQSEIERLEKILFELRQNKEDLEEQLSSTVNEGYCAKYCINSQRANAHRNS